MCRSKGSQMTPLDVKESALTRYHERIRTAVGDLQAAMSTWTVDYFQPGWDQPAPSPALDEFFSVATLSGGTMGEYHGHPLHLLDLTGNPRTRTTKTFGSLVIVARALQHI